MNEIIEKVREYVERECKKPTSKYGYDPFPCHFASVNKYSKLLAEKYNADAEIVEIASWLHDIGSIIYGREDHHLTSAKIAEQKLREMGYPEDRINQVVHCILSHRGSKNIKRETKEAQILADADSMSHFDNIAGPFMAAFLYEGNSQEQAKNSVRIKLENSYKKISAEAREIIKPRYGAAILLLS